MITFDHVTKRFPDGTVGVDDLSLEIEQGSFTVFVGPSGCGKTTSMRMINRMIDPTQGTITVDGRDISKVRPTELRLGIGYVIQNAGLMPHRTVVDNVATVLVLQGVSKRKARITALEAMERVGLDLRMATRYPAQLSGGQQQRVACARALVARPAVVFADEPTGNLDSTSSGEVLGFLRRSVEDLGQSVVMVTHDPTAASYAHRVLFLADGRLVADIADPTPETVLETLGSLRRTGGRHAAHAVPAARSEGAEVSQNPTAP